MGKEGEMSEPITDLHSEEHKERQPKNDEDDGNDDDSSQHAHFGATHLTFNMARVLDDVDDDVDVVLGEEYHRQEIGQDQHQGRVRSFESSISA